MLKNGKLFAILVGLMLFSVLLSACQPMATEMPEEDIIATSAAQTLTAVAQTESVETEQEPTPTEFPEPTNTPQPTPTATEETSNNDNYNENTSICNWGAFVEGSTVEDQSVFDPGEAFTMVWELENIGDCTWTTEYKVSFSSGYQMGAPGIMDLPQAVEPGETVEISMDMVAPGSPGTYTGYWLLTDEEGNVFGLGEDRDTPFWVSIRVTEEEGNIIYNFAENLCDAGWESSVEDDIPCPSEEDLEQGFVQSIENPQMEDGETYDEPGILSYPDQNEGGYMVGRFPNMTIEEDDHFRASIGCREDAEDCNVTFTLRSVMTGEGFDNLGSWREINEGQLYPIDVDLSDYAGMNMGMVLSVIAADETDENYAIWLDPRIVRDTEDTVPEDECNRAQFIDDVTIEDRANLEPGQAFTKTWRLRNMGECIWGDDYQVVFRSGYQMSAPDVINLPEDVEPGETVDISIDMIAPESTGIYTGYWMLRDEDGNRFGVVEDDGSPFWVRIRVTEEGESISYNFAENLCEATWRSSEAEDIPCPSEEDFEQGFVQSVDNPQLEDGRTYAEPAILTYPDQDEGGYIVGRYPPMTIEEGDHFRATIGCQYDAEDCYVNYTLRILRSGEGYDQLGMWLEDYEGFYAPIDVDLSDYAGEEVEIVLSAISADDTSENYALWLDPRIVNDPEDAVEDPTPIDDEGYFEYYDLASNYCDAGWETSVEDSISCPSEEDIEDGFVQLIDEPQLEDGSTYDEPAILTYPAAGRSGFIVGRFYDVTIEEGDLFRASIGCQYAAQDCDVRYTLRVGVSGEGLTTIGQWREIYDGQVYPIDIDLSEYAGMEIDLILSVIAQDDSQENYAMWLQPRILRETD